MNALASYLFFHVLIASFLCLVVLCLEPFIGRSAWRYGLWIVVMLKFCTPPVVPLTLPGWALDFTPTEASHGPLSSVVGANIDHAPDLIIAESSIPTSAHVQEDHGTPAPQAWYFATTQMLLLFWGIGSLVAILLVLLRAWRFARLLKLSPRHKRLQQEAKDLAEQLGLRRCPFITVMSARVPPMLWALGIHKTVVLPKELLASMEAPEQRILIAHELCHLQRRDHWVRFLSVLAIALHWWNPLVRIAMRRLESAQEQCCDATVLRLGDQSSKHYATALIHCADFLSGSPLTKPLLASPFGYQRTLKHRIVHIMKHETETPVKRTTQIMLACLALAVVSLTAQDGNSSAVDTAVAKGSENTFPQRVGETSATTKFVGGHEDERPANPFESQRLSTGRIDKPARVDPPEPIPWHTNQDLSVEERLRKLEGLMSRLLNKSNENRPVASNTRNQQGQVRSFLSRPEEQVLKAWSNSGESQELPNPYRQTLQYYQRQVRSDQSPEVAKSLDQAMLDKNSAKYRQSIQNQQQQVPSDSLPGVAKFFDQTMLGRDSATLSRNSQRLSLRDRKQKLQQEIEKTRTHLIQLESDLEQLLRAQADVEN